MKPRHSKIGLIARKDYGGLAFQTHALHRLLRPEKTLVIDSTPFNQAKQHSGWYPDAQYISSGFPNDAMVSDFIQGLDMVITCEVPYNNSLYRICRENGVKSVLQPNAELNPHFVDRTLDKPEYFILPSTWYEKETRELGVKTYVCPPPIDLRVERLDTYKEQGYLKVLHIKGKKAAYDRNGTEIVEKLDIPNVSVYIHDQLENPVDDISEVYTKGFDLVLMPRRYGGLCLPMYESLGYGLPVLMPHIPPNTDVLPSNWLLPISRSRPVRTKRTIHAYETRTSTLVNKLIEFRNMDNETFQVERLKAMNIFNGYDQNLNDWFTILQEIYDDK